MFQDRGHVVASRAMGSLATSALPCAPVLPGRAARRQPRAASRATARDRDHQAAR